MHDFYDEQFESHKPKTFNLSWGLVVIALLLLATLLFGCHPTRITSAHFDALKSKCDLSKHTEDAAIPPKWCATNYPAKERVKTNTVYKPGKVITKHDSVTVDCDSAVKYSVKYVRVACPPSVTIHDTIIVSDTIWQIDGAAIVASEKERDDYRVKSEQNERSLKSWRKWAYGLGLFSFALIALLIFLGYQAAKSYKR